MAKMIRHGYGAIHEALNDMIIAEVKTALGLLPGKKMETDGPASLCRIVVSPDGDYSPRDLGVRKVWVDGPGVLHIKGFEGDEKILMSEYTENDDMLDITDFGYLIDQIAAKVPDDGKTWHLAHESILTAGYVTEQSLKAAVEKSVTV